MVEIKDVEAYPHGEDLTCRIATVLPRLPGAAGVRRVAEGFDTCVAEAFLFARFVCQEPDDRLIHSMNSL